jgi:hypothetical protein
MNLRVGEAGVVVDHGVHERMPHQHATVSGAALLARCGGSVPITLLLSDHPPAAAVRDVAEIFHVNVDHRARIGMLVTADRLPSAHIDVPQPVQPTPDENRMDGRGRHAEHAADSDQTEPLLPTQMHDPPHRLRRRPVRGPVRARRPVLHPRGTHRRTPLSPAVRGRP